MTKFKPQFDLSKINQFAERYNYREDEKALEAGKRIVSGKRSRSNLKIIYRWKTGGRGISRLKKNQTAEIKDALTVAVTCKTEKIAMAALCGLFGVNVPVASAVLTAIYPRRYTIIDFRALEALGAKKWSPSIPYYLEYLRECRKLSRKIGVDLRTLDRALWRWSKEKSDRRRRNRS